MREGAADVVVCGRVIVIEYAEAFECPEGMDGGGVETDLIDGVVREQLIQLVKQVGFPAFDDEPLGVRSPEHIV